MSKIRNHSKSYHHKEANEALYILSKQAKDIMECQKFEIQNETTTKRQMKPFIFFPSRLKTLVSNLILAMPVESQVIERYV